MREEIVNEIRILRRKGYGYHKIARRLGISVGSAHKYGKDIPLEEDRKYVGQKGLGRRAFGKVKEEREFTSNESEKEKEEKERRKYNEELHERGTREAVKAVGEVVKLGGSLVGEKNPKGHGVKILENAWGALDVERELVERGGDARLLFGNLRKIFGDKNSLMGLGYLKIGREGIFGRVNDIVKGKRVDNPEKRVDTQEKRERKETKETKKKKEGICY